MNGIPWILVVIVGIVVLGVGMILAFRRSKEPRRVDYRNYFVTGIIWIAFGPMISLLPSLLHEEEPFFMGFVFTAMGIAYMTIGLRNRDKWGKKVELPPRANKSLIVLVTILGMFFLLALVTFNLSI